MFPWRLSSEQVLLFYTMIQKASKHKLRFCWFGLVPWQLNSIGSQGLPVTLTRGYEVHAKLS